MWSVELCESCCEYVHSTYVCVCLCVCLFCGSSGWRERHGCRRQKSSGCLYVCVSVRCPSSSHWLVLCDSELVRCLLGLRRTVTGQERKETKDALPRRRLQSEARQRVRQLDANGHTNGTPMTMPANTLTAIPTAMPTYVPTATPTACQQLSQRLQHRLCQRYANCTPTVFKISPYGECFAARQRYRCKKDLARY